MIPALVEALQYRRSFVPLLLEIYADCATASLTRPENFTVNDAFNHICDPNDACRWCEERMTKLRFGSPS